MRESNALTFLILYIKKVLKDSEIYDICLVAKANTIKQDTTQTYSFENYKFVLNIGLNTSDFNLVNHLDFAALLETIDYHYSSFNHQNSHLPHKL